ncbi:MAG TPA: hypothetical protein VN806_05925 [Caulobacteraceae bacterium]|nr:hypothetical protein [Caulobacteraceae bacterium]
MSLQEILVAQGRWPAVVNRSLAGVALGARKFDGAAFGADLRPVTPGDADAFGWTAPAPAELRPTGA